jgi:excisionase family DNA binding protein
MGAAFSMLLQGSLEAIMLNIPSSPNSASTPVLLHVVEAAEILALSRARVYQMVASGELPHVRFGKAVRIPRAALLRYIERQTVNADNDAA